MAATEKMQEARTRKIRRRRKRDSWFRLLKLVGWTEQNKGKSWASL